MYVQQNAVYKLKILSFKYTHPGLACDRVTVWTDKKFILYHNQGIGVLVTAGNKFNTNTEKFTT